MSAPKAQMRISGAVLDYTAAAAKLGGGVVEVDAGLCGVLVDDVAINLVGAAQVEGVVEVEKAQVTIVAGEEIFFDADGSPYLGTASSGAATNVPCNASGDVWMGAALAAAASTAKTVKVVLNKIGQKAGRKVGSAANPEAWNGLDEWEEILLASSLATVAKPARRIKVSTSVDMTAGQLTAEYLSATAGDGLDAAGIRALWVGAGMKGSAGVALATAAVPHCAAYMKIEDDYATNGQAVGGPTWTGAVASLVLAAQLSSNPTGAFDAILLDCQAAVNGTPAPWDAIIHVLAGGQNGAIVNLIHFDAASACAVVGAGTYSTADGYFVVKVGANTYRVPFFTAVD
jgi:hypothetical protein